MKNVFKLITVNYAEYSYFKKLPKKEKLQFLFELYEAAIIRISPGPDLSKVFDIIAKASSIPKRTESSLNNIKYVDVIQDAKHVKVESNSIIAINNIVYKFFESGYILNRNKDVEKSFKKHKVTRYMRVYNIIDRVSTICTN